MNTRWSLSVLLMAAEALLGQTRVSLRDQGKHPDFSQAEAARPFKMGTELPASCASGDMFFKTDAPSGANLYGCLAGSWSLQSGAAAGYGLSVKRTTDTILTVGGECSLTNPCRVRAGSAVYTFTSPATAGLASGSGPVRLYINSNGGLIAGIPSEGAPAVTCSGCTVVTGMNGFPTDSIPLGSWNAASGVWDATGSDARAVLSMGRLFAAGPGISISEAGSTVAISAAEAGAGGTPQSCISTAGQGYWFPYGLPQQDQGTWMIPLLGAGTAQYVQVLTPPCGMSVAKVSFEVTEACPSSCAVVFGLYDASGNLRAQTTPLTGLTSAGYYTASFADPVSLSASTVYYLLAAADNTALRLQGAWGTYRAQRLLNKNAVRVGRGNAATGSGSGLTAPMTMGALSALQDGYGVPPAVMLER